MKNSTLLFCLMVLTTGTLRSQSDYKQWETGYYRVKIGQADMFEKGVAAHNKKYHTSDPYKVGVFNVHTGPNAGSYFMVMGPVTFTQLPGRPKGAEHDADWQKNVLPYVESIVDDGFWRQDQAYRYVPENAPPLNFYRVRNYTLLPGERDRLEDQFKKIKAVYDAKKYANGYDVYWRYGASQGPHVTAELNFENWAYLDKEISFDKDFDEVHGEGAYQRFLDEFALAIDRAKTYDEIMEFRADLSSPW